MPELLANTIKMIKPLDKEAINSARARQDTLTKPQGSLGRLEELSIKLAGIQGKAIPQIRQKVIFTMAGDHGVAAEGVSAYPTEVTAQMIYNFLRGGAGINVLARQLGARVVIVDMGVATELEPHPKLISRKIAPGHGAKSFRSCSIKTWHPVHLLSILQHNSSEIASYSKSCNSSG